MGIDEALLAKKKALLAAALAADDDDSIEVTGIVRSALILLP